MNAVSQINNKYGVLGEKGIQAVVGGADSSGGVGAPHSRSFLNSVTAKASALQQQQHHTRLAAGPIASN